MAKIPVYKQGPLASSVVGTAGVDNSGLQIMHETAQNALVLADAHASAAQHAANIGSGLIAAGVADLQYQKRIATAQKNQADVAAQALVDHGNSGALAVAAIPAYTTLMNGYSDPSTDYDTAIESFPKQMKAIGDSTIQNSSIKNLTAKAQMVFKDHINTLTEQGLAHLGELSKQSRQYKMQATADNQMNGTRKLASDTYGDPAQLGQIIDTVDTTEYRAAPFTAYNAKEASKKIEDVKNDSIIQGITNGITRAQDKQYFLDKTNGDGLAANTAQAQEIQKLRGYMNPPVEGSPKSVIDQYNKTYGRLTAEQRDAYQRTLDNMVTTNEADYDKAIHKANNTKMSDLRDMSIDLSSALDAGDSTGAASIAGKVRAYAKADLQKPIKEQDPKLQTEADRILARATGVGIQAKNMAYTQQSRDLASINEPITQKNEQLTREAQQKEEYKKLTDAELKKQQSPEVAGPVIDSIDKALKRIGNAVGAASAVKSNVKNGGMQVLNSHVTAQDISNVGTMLDNAFHNGNITQAKYYDGVKDLRNYQNLVTPSNLTADPAKHPDGATPIHQWFDEQFARNTGASQDLINFVLPPNATLAEHNALNKRVTDAFKAMIDSPTWQKKKGVEGVNWSSVVVQTKMRAEQKVLNEYFHFGSAKAFESHIPLPELRPVHQTRANVPVQKRKNNTGFTQPPKPYEYKVPNAPPEGPGIMPTFDDQGHDTSLPPITETPNE